MRQTIHKAFLFILLLSSWQLIQAQHKKFPVKKLEENTCVPQTIIVKFKPVQTSRNAKVASPSLTENQTLKKLGIKNLKQLFPEQKNNSLQAHTRKVQPGKRPVDISLIYRIELNSPDNLEQAINSLLSDPVIEYAEPMYIYKPLAYLPTDPAAQPAGEQYYLNTIKAREAWEVEKGNPAITIGIVDYGFLLSHEDLKDNIQFNTDDPIDGLDNDADGYIDNYAGWDMSDNDNNLNGHVHGTFVAGVAAATPDNAKGLAGVGFKCRFLPIKADGNRGFMGFEGIIYAAQQGCDVINISWGRRGGFSAYEQDIINYAAINYDIVIVAAAGNDGNEGLFYPASYENVISVAGTNWDDIRWSGSNYNEKVDISTPGEWIYSTRGTGIIDYYNANGTSFAAPQVAGAAALLRSKYPTHAATAISQRLIATTDNIDAKNPACIGKLGRGRLNIYRALTEPESAIKSLALQQFTVTNIQKQPFILSGETASLVIDIKSMFGSFSNLKAVLSSTSPDVQILQGNTSLPTLIQGAVVSNHSEPLQIKAAPSIAANTKVLFKLDFTDNTFSSIHYFYLIINPDYLTIKNNHVSMTIGSTGRFGFDDDLLGWVEKGSGFIYKGNNLLFEAGLMMGVSPTKVSDNVLNGVVYNTYYSGTYVGGAFRKNANFFANQNLYSAQSLVKDIEVRGLFSDTAIVQNPTAIGISVIHRNYTWENDKFIIVEYQFKNISGATIPLLHAGIFANWDIQDNSSNSAEWDAGNRMGYVYNKSTGNLYAGVQLLTNEKPHYYPLDNISGVDIYNMTADAFSKAEKYTTLSSGIARTQTANGASDVAHTLAAEIQDLKNGETRTVAFAFLAGDNLADLKANAVAAKTKFIQIKTSPAPVLASKEVCKNSAAILSPANGSLFNLYSSLPLDSPMAKGNNFNLGLVTKDSTYYVTNTDSLYESQPLAVQVKSIIHQTAFAITEDTIGLHEQEFLQVADKSSNAVKWHWEFGDNTTSNQQNPSHIYNTPGKYTIKLISENTIGCKDTLTKEVLVVNGKKSLTPIISDIIVCRDEVISLSPENGNTFNFYDRLPLTSPVASGKTFNPAIAQKDTLFYVTCTDFLFESEPVAVNVQVADVKAAFEMASDTLDLQQNEILQVTNMSTKAVKWHWDFGDNSSSNEQHPLHTYIEPGEYTITLFSENSLGCKDSISQKITVVHTTGLNEDLGKYIQVYPNPTPGKLTLKFTKGSLASNSVRIQLFSQLGKQVFDKSLQGAIHSLDFSHVSKGIYILKISSGNQQLLKKIILH